MSTVAPTTPVSAPILTIGVSSSALFDMRAADEVFKRDGAEAYKRYMADNKNNPLDKGAAFGVIDKFLSYNTPAQALVAVKIISRNDPVSALRIVQSLRHHGWQWPNNLPKAVLASFTGGKQVPISKLLREHAVDFFLSTDSDDVQQAMDCGVAAATVSTAPLTAMGDAKKISLWFDFDGVLGTIDDEIQLNDWIKQHGPTIALEKYYQHMQEKADNDDFAVPGPFAGSFAKLAQLRDAASRPSDALPLALHILTARQGGPLQHMLGSLASLGIAPDSVHSSSALMNGGKVEKVQVLQALQDADLFLDDSGHHVNLVRAGGFAAAQVPWPGRVAQAVSHHGGEAPKANGEAPKASAEAPKPAAKKPGKTPTP